MSYDVAFWAEGPNCNYPGREVHQDRAIPELQFDVSPIHMAGQEIALALAVGHQLADYVAQPTPEILVNHEPGGHG